jgi:hypothetical protein
MEYTVESLCKCNLLNIDSMSCLLIIVITLLCRISHYTSDPHYCWFGQLFKMAASAVILTDSDKYNGSEPTFLLPSQELKSDDKVDTAPEPQWSKYH